jgi:PKD domain
MRGWGRSLGLAVHGCGLWRGSVRAGTFLAVMLAFFVITGVARANTYQASNTAQLVTALSNAGANPGPDTIVLAAGTYTGPFTYNNTSANNGLTIDGAGVGQTIVKETGNGQYALGLIGTGETYDISNLTLDITSTNSQGLEIDGPGEVQNVDVTYVGPAADLTGSFGILIDSAVDGLTFSHVAVDATATAASGSVSAEGIVDEYSGAVTIEDSSVTGADIGISAESEPALTLNVTRTKLTDDDWGIGVLDDTAATVSDSLIVPSSGNGAIAVMVNDFDSGSGWTGSVALDHDTIVNGGASQTGVDVDADTTGDDFTASLTNTLVYGFETPVALDAAVPGDTASASGISYSSVPNSGWATAGSGTINKPLFQVSPAPTTDPEFANTAAGDYRLLASSPLIDQGTTGSAAETDLDGLPRFVDGKGSGVAASDVGAYEYQAPTASASASATSADTGAGVAFTGTGTDVNPGETPTFTWNFGDGATATGAQVSHAFAAPGTYLVTLTVTEPAGAKATSTVSVTVTTPPATATPPKAVPPKAVPPKLSKVMVSARLASLTLSEAATLKVTLARKSGKKWKALSGSLRLKGSRGKNTFKLKGKKPFEHLRKGRYRVTIVAIDKAGQRAKVVYVTFNVR